MIDLIDSGSKMRKGAGKVYRALVRRLLHARAEKFELTDRKCIVIAPHPDDETLGCGGLIAVKRKRNIPVEVFFLTDGELSRRTYLTAEAFGAMRQKEGLAALKKLGVESSEVHFLQCADGAVSSLSPQKLEGVRSQLAAQIQPGTEVFLPFRGDGQKDHDAAWDILSGIPLRGVAVYEYFIWSLWSRPGQIARLGSLQSLEHGLGWQKRAAFQQHVSQRTLALEMVEACTQDYDLFVDSAR